MSLSLAIQAAWVLFAAVFPLYYLYSRWEDSRLRRSVQDSRRAAILLKAPEAVIFPVKICSESSYAKLYTIIPWDGAGLIVLAHASAWLEGEMADGTQVQLDLGPLPTRWLNRERWFAQGSMAFFSLGDSPNRLMVGFDTGWFQFGVVRRTQMLLRYLREKQQEIKQSVT